MLTITVPNPDDPMGMPIYEGDPEKCTTLVPGFYPCTATYSIDTPSVHEEFDESGVLVAAGTSLDGVTVTRPFYMAPDPCNTSPFWCHNPNPHSHPGSFWV